MPILSPEGIRENPWNVLSHDCPTSARRSCRKSPGLLPTIAEKSESLLANAIRRQMYVTAQQWYVPAEWQPGGADAH
jgi:hypothetical protein